MLRCFLLFVFLAFAASAQPKRILYLTHSAGFRHDSLPVSQQALREIASKTGVLEIVATEELSSLSDLSSYSAVFFFTSGELALTAAQKENLLSFVRNGGGFGGAHSATDTLYTWPEYGELIGGRFDGHPWAQEVRVDIEDPDHPATRHLSPSFSIVDEIYQFRDFDRSKARVLMTLDTISVDMRAPGINRSDNDFALAWTRLYGRGRVFYTALGHFDETWTDPRFRQMIENALLWITGQIEGDAEPRSAAQPAFTPGGIGNAATLQPSMTVSPGSLMSIYGSNLTSGATLTGDPRSPPYRLAGTRVSLNNQAVSILYASPQQINFLAPLTLENRSVVELTIEVPGTQPLSAPLTFNTATPGVFTYTIEGRYATLWTTGLGAVRTTGPYSETVLAPRVSINDLPAMVLFSGLAPGWPGLYQVNIEIPQGAVAPFRVQLSMQ